MRACERVSAREGAATGRVFPHLNPHKSLALSKSATGTLACWWVGKKKYPGTGGITRRNSSRTLGRAGSLREIPLEPYPRGPAGAAIIPASGDKLALGNDPGPVVEPPLEDSSWTHPGCPAPGFQSGTCTRDEVANTVSCRIHQGANAIGSRCQQSQGGAKSWRTTAITSGRLRLSPV